MKLYEDDEHSIRGVHIPRSAWLVLLKLRAAGALPADRLADDVGYCQTHAYFLPVPELN